MDHLTVDELITPDQLALHFAPGGLLTGGAISPEDALAYQQHAVDVPLAPEVGEHTRRAIGRLQRLHAYGLLCYDLFTVIEDQALLVMEQALAERFVELYGGTVTLAHRKSGAVATVPVQQFDDLVTAVHDQTPSSGWHVQLRDPARTVAYGNTLRPLLCWAGAEGLITGQRNRFRAQHLAWFRNLAAHPRQTRVATAVDSARQIRELAEFANGLWGSTTPGGRWFPAPRRREPVVLSWDLQRTRVTQGTPEHLLSGDMSPDETRCMIVLAVPDDPTLLQLARAEKLDAENTTYPVKRCWGPGPHNEAALWLKSHPLEGNYITTVDQVFAVRTHDGKVSNPISHTRLSETPEGDRDGYWQLLRADYASDAFVHARDGNGHRAVTGTSLCRDCPVEVLTVGDWTDVADV